MFAQFPVWKCMVVVPEPGEAKTTASRSENAVLQVQGLFAMLIQYQQRPLIRPDCNPAVMGSSLKFIARFQCSW